MKNIKRVALMLAVFTLLAGCGNTSKETYDFELTEDEMKQINTLNHDEKHDWY